MLRLSNAITLISANTKADRFRDDISSSAWRRMRESEFTPCELHMNFDNRTSSIFNRADSALKNIADAQPLRPRCRECVTSSRADDPDAIRVRRWAYPRQARPVRRLSNLNVVRTVILHVVLGSSAIPIQRAAFETPGDTDGSGSARLRNGLCRITGDDLAVVHEHHIIGRSRRDHRPIRVTRSGRRSSVRTSSRTRSMSRS